MKLTEEQLQEWARLAEGVDLTGVSSLGERPQPSSAREIARQLAYVTAIPALIAELREARERLASNYRDGYKAVKEEYRQQVVELETKIEFQIDELVEKQKYILSLERKLAEAKKNAAKWREYEDEIRLTMDPRCVRVVVERVREDGLIYRNGELLLKSDAKSIGRHVGEKLAEAVMETATAEMDRPGSIAFPTADTRWVDTYAPDGAFVKRVVSHPTTRKD